MTQHAITPERRDHLLKLSRDKGDRVRQDRRNPEVWLVSSSTYPNVWYRVKHNRSCGCEWFQRHGTHCRHLIRVSWDLHQLTKQRKEVAA